MCFPTDGKGWYKKGTLVRDFVKEKTVFQHKKTNNFQKVLKKTNNFQKVLKK